MREARERREENRRLRRKEAERRREHDQKQALGEARRLDEHQTASALVSRQSEVLGQVYRLSGGLITQRVGLVRLGDVLHLTLGQVFGALRALEDSQRVSIVDTPIGWSEDADEPDSASKWFEKEIYITREGKAQVEHSGQHQPQPVLIRFGDNTVVLNSPFGVNTIQSSYNTLQRAELPAELKDKLAALHEAVTAMIAAAELAGDEKELAAEDLGVLTQEASKPAPRPAYWRRAANGLLAIAGKVGEVGAPVIELVAAIIAMLGGSSK